MLYSFVYSIARIAFLFAFRIKIYGRENIPKGAAIICANHTSNLDAFFVAFALGIHTKPAFLAKAELFKNKLIGSFFKGIGAIPIKRGESDMVAIKNCFRALKNNKKLVIFPEGTRNKSGGAMEAKVGAAMFAVKTNSSIVPIYVSPKQKLFHKISVFIGKPYKIECLENEKFEHEQFKQLAGEIMQNIELAKEMA